MDTAGQILPSWLQPLSLETFLADYWTREAYWSGPDTARLDAIGQLLPTLDLPHLLEYAVDPIRVWYREDDRPVYGWTLPRRDALHAYRAGLTLYFHLDPTISRGLVAACGRTLLRPPAAFTLSIFAGRAGARTLPHVDGRDNFTLQLRGTKHWRVSAGREWPGIAGVRQRDPSSAVRDLGRTLRPPDDWDAVTSIEMAPGAFLYCPAAHWHTVDAVDESLSLNLSVDGSLTWADALLPMIRTALLRRNEWRRSDVGLWSPDGPARSGAESTVAALLSGLGDDLRDLDAANVLAAWSATEGAVPDAMPDTFARNPFVSCELMSADEGREFSIRIESTVQPGRHRMVKFPWASYPSFLELMGTDGVRRAGEFTADIEMVSRLLKEGVLRARDA